jgi:hypothetical protein
MRIKGATTIVLRETHHHLNMSTAEIIEVPAACPAFAE